MKLPESLRDTLKTPLGMLVLDGAVTRNLVAGFADSYLVTVGDKTTQKMIEYGLVPSLQIIDGIERREKRVPPKITRNTTKLECCNPAATISERCIDLIKQSFSMAPPVRLTIHGEEDLLVLPACIHAPDGAVVMYGQPDEGLVIVQITAEIRNKAQSLLDMMD